MVIVAIMANQFIFWVADTKPRVVIDMPVDATLFDLHLKIHETDGALYWFSRLAATEEDPDDHQHLFTMEDGTRFWDPRNRGPYGDLDEDEHVTDEIPLAGLNLHVRQRFSYEWDLGTPSYCQLIVRELPYEIPRDFTEEDVSSDYQLLLKSGHVQRQDILATEAWRSAIKRRARADKIPVRTYAIPGTSIAWLKWKEGQPMTQEELDEMRKLLDGFDYRMRGDQHDE